MRVGAVRFATRPDALTVSAIPENFDRYFRACRGARGRFFMRAVVAMFFGKGARAACGPIASVAVLLSGAPAWAQSTPTTSVTDAFTETLTFNPASVATTPVNLFSTQVLGRLNGGTVFDQVFAVPVSNAAVQSAFSAARLAVTAQGGPGVVVGAPRLLSSTITTTAGATVYSLAGTSQSVHVDVLFGPGTIRIGQISTCNVSMLPSTTRPTCTNLGGTLRPVGDNETNFNDIFTTNYAINTATGATTTTVAEVYAVDGTTRAIGTSSAAVISGAYDLVSRFMRRLSDEDVEGGSAVGAGGAPLGFAPSSETIRRDLPPELLAYGSASRFRKAPPMEEAPRYKGWAEGYGLWSRTSAQGSIVGDERRAAGLAGGFSYRVTPQWTLGFGVDQGFQDVRLAAASETAKLDLTQIGLTAAYRNGNVVANAAVIGGFGDINTSRTLPGLVAGASYNANMFGVLGEAGYRLRYGNLRVTPKAGFDFISVRTDAFTEFGAFALVAPGHTSDRTRIWGGVDLAQRFMPTATSIVDVSTYGRLVGIVSGNKTALPVAFALAPGVPLTVQGAREGDIGFDTGAKIASPIANNAIVYAAYDGRFRDGYQAHALSGGFKAVW